MRRPRPSWPTVEEITFAIVEHLVIPVAVVAMTAALLAFLLDVRSAIWTGNETLKWIGFGFAAATVLIARYEKRTGEMVVRNLYTMALGFAMVLAILDRANSWTEGLAGAAIIWLVWWFATRITERLTWLDGPPASRAPALWEVMLHPPGEIPEATSMNVAASRVAPSTAAQNAATRTVRFATLAVIAFALGEPFLVAGPPEAAHRAWGAVIVFFFAGGIVAAAASSVEALRESKAAGGEVSTAMLWTRLLAASCITAAVLLLAGLTPGLTLRGDSSRLPETDPDTEIVLAKINPDMEIPAETTGPGADRGVGPTGPDATGPVPISGIPAPIGTAPWQLLAQLARPIAAFVVLAVAVFVIAKLRGFVESWVRELGARVRELWFRLIAARWFRTGRRDDPDGMGLGVSSSELAQMSPRSAVVRAYAGLRAHLEAIGIPVRPESTPYELLADPLGETITREPLETLTELYVAAVYAGDPMGAREQSEAIAALHNISSVAPRTS